jgi:hypothetical protein
VQSLRSDDVVYKPLSAPLPGTGIAVAGRRNDDSIMLKNFTRVVREVTRAKA